MTMCRRGRRRTWRRMANAKHQPKFEPNILYPVSVATAIMIGAMLDKDSLGESLFGRGWDLNWPYGYYIFVRFIVCGVSAWVAYLGHEWKHEWAPWVFGAQAILYNPIIRIHLNVESWTVLNLIAVALFALAVLKLRPSSSERASS